MAEEPGRGPTVPSRCWVSSLHPKRPLSDSNSRPGPPARQLGEENSRTGKFTSLQLAILKGAVPWPLVLHDIVQSLPLSSSRAFPSPQGESHSTAPGNHWSTDYGLASLGVLYHGIVQCCPLCTAMSLSIML